MDKLQRQQTSSLSAMASPNLLKSGSRLTIQPRCLRSQVDCSSCNHSLKTNKNCFPPSRVQRTSRRKPRLRRVAVCKGQSTSSENNSRQLPLVLSRQPQVAQQQHKQ